MERNFELMLRSLDEIISVVQPPLPTTKDFLKGVRTFFSKSVMYILGHMHWIAKIPVRS